MKTVSSNDFVPGNYEDNLASVFMAFNRVDNVAFRPIVLTSKTDPAVNYPQVSIAGFDTRTGKFLDYRMFARTEYGKGTTLTADELAAFENATITDIIFRVGQYESQNPETGEVTTSVAMKALAYIADRKLVWLSSINEVTAAQHEAVLRKQNLID